MSFSNNTVKDYFKNKNIFITGATGFLGKVLLNKILQMQPGKLYLLIRNKQGENSFDRLTKLLAESLCFKNLKIEKGEKFENFIKNHVEVIEGDISKENLGMSEKDLSNITKHLDIVINVGASVSWKESISEIINTNLKSAVDALEIAKKANAKHFVHISTIGAIKPLHMICQKKFYGDEEFNFEGYIQKIEKMDSEEAEEETKFLKDNFGSTYVFVKAGAEKLIEHKKGDLSITIIRSPSLGPTLYDPEPGWLDNITGFTGNYFYIGLSKSLAYLVNKSNKILEMPVDIFANFILHLSKKNSETKELRIHNIISESDITVYESMVTAVNYFKANPVTNVRFIEPLFFDDIDEYKKYAESLSETEEISKKLIDKTKYFNDLYMQANFFQTDGVQFEDERMTIIKKSSTKDLKEFPLLTDELLGEKYVKLSCEGLKKFYYKT